jgi:NDP-sugar pyrophosphorylase family protein
VPKELIVLDGTNGLTVIELVLRCLYRAGIERVYLLLGTHTHDVAHTFHPAAERDTQCN